MSTYGFMTALAVCAALRRVPWARRPHAWLRARIVQHTEATGFVRDGGEFVDHSTRDLGAVRKLWQAARLDRTCRATPGTALPVGLGMLSMEREHVYLHDFKDGPTVVALGSCS